MQRRFGLLYTLFSLLVLAVLVTLVVVRINTIREFNMQEAQTSFIRLQGRLRSGLEQQPADPGSVIREYVAQVPTIEAIVLYDPDQGFLYVWTSDVDTLAFARSDVAQLRGFPSFDIRDVSQIKITAPLESAGESRLYVDGVYRVLDYGDAYVPLRDSLIALLAFAFVTVLIAIVLSVSRGPRAVRDAADSRPPAPSPRPPRSSRSDSETVAPPAATADSGPGDHDEVATSEPIVSQAATTPAPPDPLLEEVDLEEIPTDPGEPGTLFNPVTNLSYREHLEKRLGLELERAAYNDQDLTCMLVRFPDASGGGEAYSIRASQVLAAFKFEDLCFEYGKDAFCVILPNSELSRGIREAEAFKGDHAGTIYIGLSARNGRLVESSRVLGEADRSLEHAAREPGGIVGFRPDPRKYRQFVTQHLGPND